MRWFYLALLLLSLTVHAQLEVRLLETKQSGNKSLVKLELNNTYDQAIKDARAWVFLMDEDGKVVGNKAAWIIGGDRAESGNRVQLPLDKGEKNEYTLAMDTLRSREEDESPFKAKITFSRVILADGTSVNPQKAAVAPK
jgi:hypothetical protein